MPAWASLALALRSPGEDRLRSRLPTYVHPLAGRSLAWHLLRGVAASETPPRQSFLLASDTLAPEVLGDLGAELLRTAPDAWWAAAVERLAPEIDHVLLVDAAAAALGPSLGTLLAGRPGRAVIADDGGAVAVWMAREDAERRCAEAGSLDAVAQGLEPAPAGADAFVVRDRARLARAGALIRDRLVQRLMEDGVTFLIPESVLVDVDVRIGADTLVYPGAILEGNTTIGAETVIGPGCRVVDSWIGSGVELKGWNYIVGANIRNRAVLEPHVRRGFD